MKSFWNWIVKHIPTLFNVIGIILTIYFGVFYAPSWLREMQDEKLKNAESELQIALKEMVYADSLLTISELEFLVQSKELNLKQKYPLSKTEILVKTQESFIEDKFLPLEVRRELIQEIELLKEKLPSKTDNEENQRNSLLITLASVVIGVLSTLFAILGVTTQYKKAKIESEKQEEIENSVTEAIRNDQSDKSYDWRDYEFEITDAITQYPGLKVSDRVKAVGEIDLEFSFGDKAYFVEIKYLHSKVGLNSLHQLIHLIQNNSGEAWLVYNTDVTPMVRQKVKDFNRSNKSIKIVLVRAVNAEDLINQLPNLLSH